MQDSPNAGLPDEHVRQRHLDRLVMMSDGVFAIALTLSAVELHPEMGAGESFWHAWATPLAIYFMSFLLIAGVWVAHRRNLAHMVDVDAVTTWLNLLLLAMVGLMPVVIRFVLTHLAAPGNIGMIAYAVMLAATYGSLALAWGYAALYAGLAPNMQRRLAWAWLAEYLFVALLFAALATFFVKLVWIAAPVAMVGVALRIASVRLQRGAQGNR